MDDLQRRRIRLNVGGKVFETTASTLHRAGPNSLLAVLSVSDAHPIFIDRDPDLFSVLLSLLRSGRIPYTAHRRFSNQEIAEEALYYGLDSYLRTAMSPSPFDGIDAGLFTTVHPASDAFVSSFSPGTEDGSVWLAHAGQISAYDWNLSHVATVRTHLEGITSIRRASADVAVVGSTEAAGLHFYNVISGGRHVGSVHWVDKSDLRVYKARVASIATGSSCIFAALESPHRENGILAVDKTTLKVTQEIGRQRGSSTKTAVPGKLSILEKKGLVFASAVSGGAFGYSGYMRLWDPRTCGMVWETVEPGSGTNSNRFGDSFADVDVDREEESAIYKVCWKSGDVAVADLRKLGNEDPWVYLKDRRKGQNGDGSVIHRYRNQVFVAKNSGLEVWTEKEFGFRRNLVEKEEHTKLGMIENMEGGGERLFLRREGVEGVEVWETSNLSGGVTLDIN